MAVETLTHVYTSQGEIERIAFGETGSPIAVNDIAVEELATFWIEITEEASDFINEFAEMRYSPVDLVDSRWVRSRAAWVGAYLLSLVSFHGMSRVQTTSDGVVVFQLDLFL